MGLSSAGVGSGLDVASIVTQLMNAERVPLNILKAKETSYNAKVSSYGTIKSAVSTFQSALEALTSATLGAQKAVSGDTSILNATASSGSTSGTYKVTVTQLAKEHKLASVGHADTTTLMGSGTMSIQVGSGAAVDIAVADYSLKSLNDAINASDAGVSATIINDGTSDRLVISAKDSGVANTVSITATGGLAEFDTASGTMSTLQTGLDATLTINDIPITKSSNSISDAVAGITFDLVKFDAATVVNVVVSNDKDAVKKTVNDFVAAYNTLTTKLKELTAYDPSTKKGGALNGDQGAKSMLTSLRAQMIEAVSGGSLTSLADVGINFDKDGKLAVTDATLTSALSTKFSGFANLFTAADGFATRLDTVAEDLLDTDGLIATRTEGLQATLKTIAASELAMELRLEATEKRIRAQFTALDTIMNNMQQTSSFLTQQLAALDSSY